MNPDDPKPVVLAIDDAPVNIDTVKAVLGAEYRVQAAVDGSTALKILERMRPDLILLDIVMPEIDGYQVCERIKADPLTREIPVIFLTGKSDEEDEARGLALGAVDYITKPISPAILSERVKTHLALKAARDLLQRQNEILEEKVLERTRQMEELQDVAMVAMGSLAETRDPETGNHIRRTQHYVKLLAMHLRHRDGYRDVLTPEAISMLFKSAPLHDIGKVGIPDAILLKPGKLTDEEFEVMKKHATYGRDAIASARKTLSGANNFLIFAEEIARSHHEKWDGSGYPEGLKGEAIPLSARLMAIADVYDALVTRRVYKPAFPHEQAVAIVREGRGTHFDPELVDGFLEIAGRFDTVAREFSDADAAVSGDPVAG
jgi:putative two-component system response regulator